MEKIKAVMVVAFVLLTVGIIAFSVPLVWMFLNPSAEPIVYVLNTFYARIVFVLSPLDPFRATQLTTVGFLLSLTGFLNAVISLAYYFTVVRPNEERKREKMRFPRKN